LFLLRTIVVVVVVVITLFILLVLLKLYIQLFGYLAVSV